jgi:hypothetical protein
MNKLKKRISINSIKSKWGFIQLGIIGCGWVILIFIIELKTISSSIIAGLIMGVIVGILAELNPNRVNK